MEENYRRHLPHQVPDGFPIFLTWNLKGALPKRVLCSLTSERERLERQPQRAGEDAKQRRVRHDKIVFGMMDRYLNNTAEGPLHLKDPRAARVVVDAMLFGASTRYGLYAFVVMANHVHVLLTPRTKLARITQGIKGFTAHQINQVQGRRGRTLWQDESYDHWARDEEEMIRIIEYIENNPVTAGLCVRPEEWPWSSAARRANWPVGQAFQPDPKHGQAGKPDLRVEPSGWKA
jgi:REP element-mobilizing transposase RayT